MRGIVELEVLKAIEEKLPPRIPIRNFFDLIVGTRFVIGTNFFRAKQTAKACLDYFTCELGFWNN